LESARRDRDTLYPGYVLMLLAGLRPAEVLGLGWADVDLATGMARVGYGLYVNGRTGWVRRPLRASKAVPNPWGPIRLPDPCLAVLRHHYATTRDASPQEGTGRRPAVAQGCGLVITTRSGQPLTRSYFRKRYAARVARAGVPGMSAGRLGPTTAALLVALHVPPPIAIGIVDRRRLATPRELAAAVTRAAQPYPPIRPNQAYR
jgi:integrase